MAVLKPVRSKNVVRRVEKDILDVRYCRPTQDEMDESEQSIM